MVVLGAGLLACAAESTTAKGQVESVQVTPATFAVATNQSQQFTAQATDGDGSVVSAAFTWGATGGTISATGLFTASATPGAALVWATGDGIADTVEGTVSAPAGAALDTVFFEGFEANSFATWDDRGREGNQSIVTSEHHSGSRALRIALPAGSDGGWLSKFFLPGYDSLYVSMWVKLQSPWDGPTKFVSLTGSRTDNVWSAIGTAGKCPTGTDFFVAGVTMDQAGNGTRFTRFYDYYPSMPRESDGTTCYGSFGTSEGATYASNTSIPAGDWHQLEYWIKLDAPGDSDSEQVFWLDGVQIGDWNGISFRTSTVLRLNTVTITASRGGGTAQVMYVDDLLVTTRRP